MPECYVYRHHYERVVLIIMELHDQVEYLKILKRPENCIVNLKLAHGKNHRTFRQESGFSPLFLASLINEG